MSESDFATVRAEHERALAELRAAELAVVSADGNARRRVMAMEMRECAARELDERQRTARRARRCTSGCTMSSIARTRICARDLNFQLRPELSELASAFLAELTDGRYDELELDDQYNILVLEDGTAEAGHLGWRGGSGEPGAAARHLADDRGARGAAVLAAHSGRDLRLAG